MGGHKNSPWERLQFGGELLDRVGLDHISDLKFVEPVDADAALHAGADFVDFVLKAAQGQGVSFVNQALAAHHPDLSFEDASVADAATGDTAALGQFEDLFY